MNDAQDDLGRALAALRSEVRARVERHPWRQLLEQRLRSVEIRFDLDLAPNGGDSSVLDQALDDAVRRLLFDGAVLRPGAVPCLRCGSADCDHARPKESRQVFVGFGSTGIPRFEDLGQALLERRDENVDRLYGRHGGRGSTLVATVWSEQELTTELLEVFQNEELPCRILGQVTCGWYGVPGPTASDEAVAVSCQALAWETTRRRRLALNVVGVAPGGADLETIFDTAGTIPWHDAVAWARRALEDVERSLGGRRGRASLDRRVAGILEGLRRRLLRPQKVRKRRTKHARVRRAQDRPVALAMRDLDAAGDEAILWDTRRETWVVLGDRGRAHVFNDSGRLVTSLRFDGASVERRKHRGIWRPAARDSAHELRRRVRDAEASGAGSSGGGEG